MWKRLTTNRPIKECHDYAANEEYQYFAVQSEDDCFTAADAEKTYKRHGRANNCEKGVGDDNAQDVYKIVSCKEGTV